jgi:hypothetical protein
METAHFMQEKGLLRTDSMTEELKKTEIIFNIFA